MWGFLCSDFCRRRVSQSHPLGRHMSSEPGAIAGCPVTWNVVRLKNVNKEG